MPKKFIEGNYTLQQMESMLRTNCESKVETKYYRDLTEQDLVEKHQELSKNLIEMNQIEDEFKVVKDEFKDRLKPMAQKQKELLDAIKVKKELHEGTLYTMANHEDGVMETYTETGEFYESRRMKPEERQARLFVQDKAVNE
jgi:hypothetical protein